MNAAAEIDSCAAAPLLVFGSLPPAGADLDLLVRDEDEEAVAACLARIGFDRRGTDWVRFRDCSADAVELVPASDWRLPQAEVERLFAEARPIEGLARLVRPSARHEVLILARRVALGGGVLDAKRRARLDAALADDPGAWDGARSLAASWRAALAVEALAECHANGRAIPRTQRLRALGELRGRVGGPAEALRRGIGRRRSRGFVVAFSGLDGAGKSTQAEALRETLEGLGVEAEVIWTSLIAHGSLGAIATPVKKLLALLGRRAPPSEGPDETWSESAPTHRPDHGTAVRRKSAVITFVWTTLAAVANGRWQGREARPRIRRGQAAICDRYTLDTKVHFRYEYGERRSFRFQTLVVRLLSPKPLRAYLIDVRPETAHARKGEYELHQLERRARLYREEAARLGVRKVDGERPREQICAEIARDVWLALG